VARLLHVYPKATLEGSTWTFYVNVYEHDSGVTSRFVHTIAAGVTVTTPLSELKIGFDLTVDDTDTDLDVDDALFLDDIRPGPQTATVIGNWIGQAEDIIDGLTDPTVAEYWAGWSHQDTAKIRQDTRRALVTQRGWTITFVHQHEGDGTTTDET